MARIRGVFAAIAPLVLCACGGRACASSTSTRATADGAEIEPRAFSPAASVSSRIPPEARFVGRFEGVVDHAAKAGGGPVRFAWSGSRIDLRFEGTSVAMHLRTAHRDTVYVGDHAEPTAYSVVVDEAEPVSVDVRPDRPRYELARGLELGRAHTVSILREAEAFAGADELVALELPDGGRFLPVEPKRRRIEIVGDSITCGYGILGPDASCRFSFATERASVAYGALVGRAMDAEVTTPCWSGRGVFRNYEGTFDRTMPELYALTIPTADESPWPWAPSGATPSMPERLDAVVVNLGTNDWLGGQGRPLDVAAFESSYDRFLRHLRDVQPDAWIVVTLSPMLGPTPTPSGPGTVRERAKESLERIVAKRRNEGETRIAFLPFDHQGREVGCDRHPNAAMHRHMAAQLETVLREKLGP